MSCLTNNKEILDFAKSSYEREKQEKETYRKIKEQQKKDRLWNIKKQLLTNAMWRILNIAIDEKEIKDIDIGGLAGWYWVPSMKVDGIIFVYDDYFTTVDPFEQHSLEFYERWGGESLKIYGPCNRYNGLSSPCGKPGVSVPIKSTSDLGRILSEGVKANHGCRIEEGW